MNKKGFTIIELLVVLGASAVISAISIATLIQPQTQADLDGEVLKLMSDIKSQQLNAMIGVTSGTSTPVSQGIYFSIGGYTLFRGTTYVSADPENFSIVFPATIQMQGTTLATSTIIFNRLNGEVYAHTPGADSVTFINTVSNATSTLTINRFGAIFKNP